MADTLGVSQPTIWRWLNQSKQMPAEYVLRTEEETGVSRHDLRPDIYPRKTMIDHHVGQRFQGVDAYAGRFPLHGTDDSRALARVDFNRSVQLKGAP
ncbi:YdaS family helix-turn-helix protein [Citromicrobium bathyomarinum]